MDTPKTPQQASIPVPKSRRGLKGFITESVRELKKVDWPSPKETNRLTGIVLAVCALAVGVLYGMSFISGFVIDKVTKGF